MSITKIINGGLSGQSISATTLYSNGDLVTQFTGGTIEGLTATTISGGTIYGDGSNLSGITSSVTGEWVLSAGTNTVSFTVDGNNTYSLWVLGNIPNGIVKWNANVTLSNENVPAVGSQYGWYYVDGNQLVLTSIPDQIVGTSGSIINAPSSYTGSSNIFTFGITNNSGSDCSVQYGYVKL